jgi:hypothetical protein
LNETIGTAEDFAIKSAIETAPVEELEFEEAI